MANEEKILEMLGTINDRLGRLEASQDKMQAAQDKMQAAQDKMQAAQDKMQEDITKINVTLEVKIAKEIQFLADGHMGIIEQLHKLDEIEAKLEEVSIRADSAHAAAVVNEYEITQLKQVR